MSELCKGSHLSYLFSVCGVCLADRKETASSKRTLRNIMKGPNNPYLSNPSKFLIKLSVIFCFKTYTADSKTSAADVKWFWYVITLVSYFKMSTWYRLTPRKDSPVVSLVLLILFSLISSKKLTYLWLHVKRSKWHLWVYKHPTQNYS